jgi:hypothetical protein
MPCRAIQSKDIVRNNGVGSTTGTGRARIKGLSSLLQIGIFVAYFTDTKTRPASFSGNTFSIFAYVNDQEGSLVQLSDTPINNDGAGSQQAPDGWEGVTTLPEVEVRLAATGITPTANAGSWKVIVVAEPAEPMSDEMFEQLVRNVNIAVDALLTIP